MTVIGRMPEFVGRTIGQGESELHSASYSADNLRCSRKTEAYQDLANSHEALSRLTETHGNERKSGKRVAAPKLTVAITAAIDAASRRKLTAKEQRKNVHHDA